MISSKLFEKILIATDGSEKNKSAVEEAVKIARACGSTVYAVYVMDESLMKSAIEVPIAEDLYRRIREEGEEAVNGVKEIAQGVNLETFILSGRPARAITEFAEQKEVDLIVVGTQGKSGIERFLLGSVADEVIRTAGCPVLTIKSRK
ncbi:Universal stress protein [Methanosarcina barkeri str. Wiesmoor]|uniref:Universal stress protein n=2 Tax=Methanosarcina barkeri TaxID=2208 RepID=A0A0E3QJB3_METBA|nr:universal stress protein [Methanosarcina barkeri]AKB50952.1 Universal stress protein [Methanosarcina barkeri str. Wiesmoor]